MLGERIKRQLTQVEMAALLGIAQARLSRIERAESVPTLSSVRNIAGKLGYKVSLQFSPL